MCASIVISVIYDYYYVQYVNNGFNVWWWVIFAVVCLFLISTKRPVMNLATCVSWTVFRYSLPVKKHGKTLNGKFWLFEGGSLTDDSCQSHLNKLSNKSQKFPWSL